MTRKPIALPENIQFTNEPGATLKEFISTHSYSRLVVLVDDNTNTYCYPIISSVLPTHEVIVVPDGEEHKNLNTSTLIWQAMTDLKLDRHALLIVIGGGVLGDMGGFCAATYKRGIDFILVPTTLLSQVDASIGGKLGIDFNSLKNHIGVFQMPILTLLYSGFLKTLPESELRSGFAEIVKHILISDKNNWESIRKKSLKEQDWESLIDHSVLFKAKVTSEDPKEKGLRKILNAGHTIGHALETYFISHQQPVLHGEAIAIGLIAEGFIAYQKSLLKKTELDEIVGFILSIYDKLELTTDQIDAISDLVIQDKKNKGNKILCVLLDGIGKARWDVEISPKEVKDALSFYGDQT
jgi:3-dehydroquinate synthase